MVSLVAVVAMAAAALPPLPPVGPDFPGPPQPNCTTCKFPQHSWAKIPTMIHTSTMSTGPTGAFGAAALEVLKKVPLVIVEKWQGVDAVDADGKRVFLWEEDAWIAAAKSIKAVNPAAVVIGWLDTTLIYTGWRLDGNTKIFNTTLNPDAGAECNTGHFRNAEFLERHPELLLHNKSGLPSIYAGQCHVYDHRQPRVRQYWRDMCLNLTASGGGGLIDGCGADFSAGPENSMAKNVPFIITKYTGTNDSVAAEWIAGQRQMMIDTTAALGGGLLVAKDSAELGDHANAVLHEGCSGNNDTITMLRDLTARATAMGTQFNYNCHSRDGIPNSTLAAFLIGAGRGHYVGIGAWNDPTYNKLDTHWQPEFDLPLGNPASDGEYNPATATWTRRFQSAYVTFNAKTNEGAIQWGSTSRPS